MSLSCQYEQMNFSNYLGDIVRQVSVEARLRIPENNPRVAKIKGGEFRAEPPVLTVNEGLLIVTGKLNPHLIYLADQNSAEEQSNGRENDADVGAGLHTPQEFGISWGEEAGVGFEERIEIPGLNPEMFVEVDLKPQTALYEKENSYEAVFHGVLDIVVHTALPQRMELVSDVVTQPSGRVNVRKEQVMVEEFTGVKTVMVPLNASLLLPNYKPGVQRVLDFFVRPVGVSSELYNGKVAVKGQLEVALIYVGADDEGQPTEIFVNDWNRETETAIPFETFIDYGVTGRILAEPKIIAKNLTLENKSQRELRCQMDLECDVKLMRIEAKEFVVDVTSDAGEIIDREVSLVNLEEFAEECQGYIEFEEEVKLPAGVPDIERLLTYRGILEDMEVEAVENKLVFNGNLNIGLYYVAEGTDEQRLFQTGWDRQSGNSLPVS
ncbi:MAG TPA: DUF3794 domain-containing protein, partial [Bacillota bacterium]|nr:DUF3794 domain-containing protein [Bacillota bacterium]